MWLLGRVFGLSQERLVLGRYSGLAAGHGADHEVFRIDRSPARQLRLYVVAHQLDSRGVQVTDPQPGSSQSCDIPAGPIGTFLPHGLSMALLRRRIIP